MNAARRLSGPLTLVVVLAVAILTPGPSAAAVRAADGAAGPALAAAAGDYSINLYREGDFVSQYTAYWCIGASMQMMLNVIGLTDDDRRASQERYMRVARSSGPSLRQVDHGQGSGSVAGLGGAGSSGWARGLVELGAGLYQERALDDYDASLKTVANAVRKSNRPVGLIVWRGAHAWVVTGFTATGDPLTDPDYRVTGVYVQDPWYPRVSSIWGPGQKPNTWISTRALKADFLPRARGRWHVELAGKFVLVLPVDPVSAAPRGWRTL